MGLLEGYSPGEGNKKRLADFDIGRFNDKLDYHDYWPNHDSICIRH